MKFYDAKNNRLICAQAEATADFWDNKWNQEDLSGIIKRAGEGERFVVPLTKKYLKPSHDVKILEGGCGLGHYVYSLDKGGYDVYGVDFAKNTVKKINEFFPDLKVVYGDVTKLDFPDNYFNGYWSLGVIEHFKNDYGAALAEMVRVLKNNGYIFLTFPSLSWLRRLKIKLNFYQPLKESGQLNFYQYIFDSRTVIEKFEERGFILLRQKRYDGLFGLLEETGEEALKKILEKIYICNGLLFKILRYFINKTTSFFCGHISLLIFQKNIGQNN